MIDDLRKGIISALTTRKDKLISLAWVFVAAWSAVGATLVFLGLREDAAKRVGNDPKPNQ